MLFLYLPGVTPFSLVNTLTKCGTSLKPTSQHISDTDFRECSNMEQAVSSRYCMTNCEKVIPLQRLNYELKAERFMPTSAAMSSRAIGWT